MEFTTVDARRLSPDEISLARPLSAARLLITYSPDVFYVLPLTPDRIIYTFSFDGVKNILSRSQQKVFLRSILSLKYRGFKCAECYPYREWLSSPSLIPSLKEAYGNLIANGKSEYAPNITDSAYNASLARHLTYINLFLTGLPYKTVLEKMPNDYVPPKTALEAFLQSDLLKYSTKTTKIY